MGLHISIRIQGLNLGQPRLQGGHPFLLPARKVFRQRIQLDRLLQFSIRWWGRQHGIQIGHQLLFNPIYQVVKAAGRGLIGRNLRLFDPIAIDGLI